MKVRKPSYMRRIGAGAIVALALAGGGAGSLALGAGVANAATSACGVGSTGGNIRTCLSVGQDAVAIATIAPGGQGKTIRLCITEDGQTRGCSAYTAVPRGGTKTFVASLVPIATAKGATFQDCAHLWRQNPDGTTTQIATPCVTV